jgi:hypothetical protein
LARSEPGTGLAVVMVGAKVHWQTVPMSLAGLSVPGFNANLMLNTHQGSDLRHAQHNKADLEESPVVAARLDQERI